MGNQAVIVKIASQFHRNGLKFRNCRRLLTKSTILTYAIALLLCFQLILGKVLDDIITAPNGTLMQRLATSLLSFLSSKYGIFYSLIVLLTVFSIVTIYIHRKDSLNKLVYNYRYVIAFLLFLIAVVFSISGSSIACWGRTLPDGSNRGLLFGTPRGVRTDEWALFTPMTIAQFLDPQGKFPYNGEVFRGTATDMFIIYGQPVHDIAMLFRPFQVGFLFLGLNRGLAFFWYGRLIALFMATFEFGMLITNRDKLLSVSLGAMTTFAPVVQWWFSINGFVEMIIFSEIIIIALREFFITRNIYKKVILCAVLVISSGSFIFTLYPAWEIPMGYVIFSILIGTFASDYKIMQVRPARDFSILGIGIVTLLSISAHIAMHSSDAIHAVMNTAYPGKRISTGGGGLLLSMRYPISYFLPYIVNPEKLSIGVDGQTAFVDLFPLGLILALYLIFRKKQHDPVLISLVSIAVILGWYCFIGFPVFLAKATLLGNTITERALVIFSFVNLLLLFRSITLIRTKQFVSTFTPTIVISLIITVIIIFSCHLIEPNYMGIVQALVAGAAIMLGCYFTMRADKQIIAFFCCCTAMICGLLVNPVQQGVNVATDSPLVEDVRDIVNHDKNSLWVTAVSWQGNLTTLAGAKTLTSTNTYPNSKLWNVLDPNHSREQEWNRYAHLQTTITSRHTNFSLKQVDVIQLSLSVTDLQKLHVDYIVTNDNDSKLALDHSNIATLISDRGGYSIYSIAE